MAKSYAIVGSGALGAFYGCKLQHAGLHVDFLVHGDYEHVKQHGWYLQSKDGDIRLPSVNVHRSLEEMRPADVVIVGLKTTSNALIGKLVPPLVGPDSVVLVLQNGLGVEEAVAEHVPPEQILGGCCFLCSNKIGPGVIHHLDYGTIAMGEFSRVGVTERLQAIAEDFEKSGITIQRAPDLLLARWKKLVWNIPFNGLSVVLDAQTDEMMSDRSLRRLVEEVMAEVVGCATADGKEIDREFVESMLDHTAKMKPYKTSMKVDYDSKRPLEIDAIFGEPLRRAERAGLTAPVIRSIHAELTFLDARNCRGAG